MLTEFVLKVVDLSIQLLIQIDMALAGLLEDVPLLDADWLEYPLDQVLELLRVDGRSLLELVLIREVLLLLEPLGWRYHQRAVIDLVLIFVLLPVGSRLLLMLDVLYYFNAIHDLANVFPDD